MGSLALEHALAAAGRGLAVFPLSRTKLPAIRSPHRARAAPGAPPGSPATPHGSAHSDVPPEPPAEPPPPLPDDAPSGREPLAVEPCQGECGLPGHGVHDATSDPAGVRALFAVAPWATGYGIACGREPLHLVGLDLDVKHGTDSLRALELLAAAHEFAIPPTTTVLTPSGGRHLWLRGPRGVRIPNSAGRLAAGIDVRGHGGYLVGPGSVTVRGTYRLAPGSLTQAPAPVPRALLTLLTPPPRTRRPSGPVPYDESGPGTALVHFVRGAPVGQRNARLFWAACRAYETGRGDRLAGPLTEAAVAVGLPEHEARTTIASAAHRAARYSVP